MNKIDVPGANPEKVRGQLTEFGLVPEEYGGSTMFVDISAKQGTNVDKLLEAVLLTADAELDLRANPDMDARGATVEARLDKGRGAVAVSYTHLDVYKRQSPHSNAPMCTGLPTRACPGTRGSRISHGAPTANSTSRR